MDNTMRENPLKEIVNLLGRPADANTPGLVIYYIKTARSEEVSIVLTYEPVLCEKGWYKLYTNLLFFVATKMK